MLLTSFIACTLLTNLFAGGQALPPGYMLVLPRGNHDALQPWDIDRLTVLQPVVQFGEWRQETRLAGDRLYNVAVSIFKTAAGAEILGVIPINVGRATPTFMPLQPKKVYLLCGMAQTEGRLEFPSYGNPYEQIRRASETLVLTSQDPPEVAIQAIFPWSNTQQIDPSDKGHSVLLGLVSQLLNPSAFEAGLARHEMQWLGLETSGFLPNAVRDWVLGVLAPRVAALNPATASQALSVRGLLVGWRVWPALEGYLQALEAVAADPKATIDESSLVQYFWDWGGQQPGWAKGKEGAVRELELSRRLLRIAASSPHAKIHIFALRHLDAGDEGVWREVFRYLDSDKSEVVETTLQVLSSWSRRPERQPVYGPNAQAENKRLAELWKSEGVGALLNHGG